DTAVSLQLFWSAPWIKNGLEFGNWSTVGEGPSSVNAPVSARPRTGVATSICAMARAPEEVCASAVSIYTMPYVRPLTPSTVATATAPEPGPLLGLGVM